ncbi:MAG: glutamate-cysteine ligase family protein [Gammaproteobacteria bacterium]
MGQEIPTSQFTKHDFSAFREHLRSETETLRQYFRENQFICQHNTGGFEVEAWLVDEDAVPLPINEKFLKALNYSKVVHELSKFNFEINVEPQPLKNDALDKFYQELLLTWNRCHEVAGSLDADVMAIGIHPGIIDEELTLEHMSTSQRYRALNEQVMEIRNGLPLTLNIRGKDHLNTVHHNVMLEAATTSFQIHYQIKQQDAVRSYNAAQIISAPLVAVSANSPYLFGCDLWDETRIRLFEQSVDVGMEESKRVTFGHEYVKGSLFSCFEENLEKYAILIPLNDESNSAELPHLRLHNGTIWRWNRPLVGFDREGHIHLRIENRVVPSGPSMIDMVANASLFWGLVHFFASMAEPPEYQIEFPVVRQNFYNAARYGMRSSLHWLDGEQYEVNTLLLDQLLPAAEQGLEQLGISDENRKHYLTVIEQRIRKGQNGAVWQRRWVEKYGKDMKLLSKAYLERQQSGCPVHEWDI